MNISPNQVYRMYETVRRYIARFTNKLQHKLLRRVRMHFSGESIPRANSAPEFVKMMERYAGRRDELVSVFLSDADEVTVNVLRITPFVKEIVKANRNLRIRVEATDSYVRPYAHDRSP